MRAKFSWLNLWPALVIIPLVAAAITFDQAQVDHQREEAREHVASIIGLRRARIEDYLNARIHLVHSLAAFVRTHPSISTAEFDTLGREMVAGVDGIRALQLAPGAVIAHVVPRAGNEEAIGHDLLADTARRGPVDKTIETRSITLGGPYSLRQGGEGIIGRVPIFVAERDGERFWGLAIIVLDLPKLLAATGTETIAEGVRIGIRGRDGLGPNGEPFFGDANLFGTSSLRALVTFPSGSWEIAGMPEAGWPASWWGRPLLVVATTLLCLAFAAVALRLGRQARRLELSAATALRSEKRFRVLFDETVQLTGTVSPAGILTAINQTACDLVGIQPEQVIGLPFWETPWWSHDAALAEKLRAGLNTAADGELVRFECSHPHKAGGKMDVEFTAKPLTDAGGQVVELLVEGRDITERKRTERLLEARLRLAEMSATHSLHDLLVATLDEMCELTASEIGFYHFLLQDQLTLSLQAWSTRTSREFCHATASEQHYDVDAAGVWADAVRLKRSVVYNDYPSLETRRGLPHGHAEVRRLMSIPIVRDGNITAIIGVGNKAAPFDDADLAVVETLADLAWDLAERKKAEDALADRTMLVQRRYECLRALNGIASLPGGGSHRQLDEALALGAKHLGLPIGIVSRVEGEDYCVVHHCAPADSGLEDGQSFDLDTTYCTITLQAKDVVAIPHMARSPHHGHPCYQTFGLEAYIGAPIMVGGQRYGTVNFSSPSPYHREFDDGDIEFMRLLARWVGSVLEREQAEAEVVAARDTAEIRAKELASSNSDLEQFAYVASHDLRQPLRMVNSYLALIERRYADKLDEDGREFIGYARDGALQMDQLILDLLEYSRVGRHGEQPEPVDLAQVAAEARHRLEVLAIETGAAVEVEAMPATVNGNRTELVRLFQNLIGNAIKYRAPGRPPHVEVRWSRQGGQWQVSVKDNGIGIAPEFHQDIFKIFRRLHTSQEYDGTGIGLAVCQKIVKHLGGSIWVESTPGEGTTFLFTAPAGAAP